MPEVSDPNQQASQMPVTAGEKMKCGAALVFFGFTVLVSLVMFPIFIISAIQLFIRIMLAGMRHAFAVLKGH